MISSYNSEDFFLSFSCFSRKSDAKGTSMNQNVTQLKFHRLFLLSLLFPFVKKKKRKLGYYLIDDADNRDENRIIEIWDNRRLW